MVNDHVVATAFDDGEGVLVDLETKRYYRLNETAMLVWCSLEDNLAFEDIVTRMTQAYDVSAEHATASIQRLVGLLDSYRLTRSG